MANRRDVRYASVLDKPLTCLICSGEKFYSREIKMQTTGMTFFDLDWANESAEGVVCSRCGFLHTFASRAVQWSDRSGDEPVRHPVDLSEGGKHPEFRDLR